VTFDIATEYRFDIEIDEPLSSCVYQVPSTLSIKDDREHLHCTHSR